MTTDHGPSSIVFQVLQDCAFQCEICLRHYDPDEMPMSLEERKLMVGVLKKCGIRRLTVTGGEPMLLGEELFDFLKYVHQRHIHVCLSTTGYKLDRARIGEMDGYIDQLLISIRSLIRATWRADFGGTNQAAELFDTVVDLLQWVKTTGIIVEVSTVVHRENVEKVIDLGWQLVSLNPNIIWRLDDFYGTGFGAEQRSRFELGEDEFNAVYNCATQTFGHLFRHIRCARRQDRARAPDFLILANGDLIATSSYRHGLTGFNILRKSLPAEFKMRRPWSEYRRVCRDWGWGDL